MKKIIFIIICLLLLVGCTNKSAIININGNEALKLIDEGQAIIIDVRSVQEYQSGHIKDSINIPFDIISFGMIEQYVSNKEIKIIVYCRSGNRSKQAAQTLIDLGYSNVYDLGSIDNWYGEKV